MNTSAAAMRSTFSIVSALTRVLPPLGWVILLTSLVLTGLGLLAVWAGGAAQGEDATLATRQLGHLLVGLVGLGIIQVLGYRRIGQYAYLLFGVTLVLLTLLLVAQKVNLAPIIPARRNTFRWIVLGPINIQVSEYAKVVYILALAWYLRFRTNYRSLAGLLGPFVLTLIPLALILKEPDLGTSLLLLPTLMVMLFVAGAKTRHLSLVIALGAIAAPVFYFSPFMNPYQRERIHSLMQQDESNDRWRLGAGYQLHQSKIALGSGRLAGQGLSEGGFFRHNLLPEEHNDFIFAVLGHQWGFIGGLAILSLYMLIIAMGLTVASSTTDPFGRLLAVGVCALICAQTIINVGMTIGLMPVTGMTLPFVSMGGSGLITNYLAIGLLIDVARPRPADLAPRPFEFDHEAYA
ncbi:Peptidoglycan glycosyltransferase MrdB [Phycisphaerae bacterium RAS2]|nr:Peptidoglycan glycosyltransferase MrdB [Phycisphaerae bacterium RAS2]